MIRLFSFWCWQDRYVCSINVTFMTRKRVFNKHPWLQLIENAKVGELWMYVKRLDTRVDWFD